jgi:hypothetical protein
MRAIVLGGIVGLWICAAAYGQVDEPLALDMAPAATEPAPLPELPSITPEMEPLRLEAGASNPAVASTAATSQPATQPGPLRIAGLPAGEWLHVSRPIQAHNLEGRLWVLGILEPWSDRSIEAAGRAAALANRGAPRAVDVFLVSVAPADEIRQVSRLTSLSVPIAASSPLPLLLSLEPLPRVYLVGPDYAVVWSGPLDEARKTLDRYYDALTPGGLSKARENELANRLNRARSAFDPAAPLTPSSAERSFAAVGLASTVLDAAPPGHPLARQAADLLEQIDKAGQSSLSAAREQVRRGETLAGYQQLQSIAAGFYGRQAGMGAVQELQSIDNNPHAQSTIQAARDESSAAGTLRLAEEAMSQNRYADAERLYRMLGEVYPRTRAATQARRSLVSLHRGKAAATRLAEQAAEPQAPILLSLATRYAQMGRADQARQVYRQVLQVAAGTPYARQAQEALSLLAGASSQPDSK